MRLPALISFIDATHCSINCQFMNSNEGCCSARGYDPNHRERLNWRNDSTHFLRTEYCQKKASNSHVKIETCPKCGGVCEGETYSYKTMCTKCGSEFVRVEDQDEHYLQGAQGYEGSS
jgi:hypothetical protein